MDLKKEEEKKIQNKFKKNDICINPMKSFWMLLNDLNFMISHGKNVAHEI